MNWPWSKTKRVKCPDGHVAIVYDIDKALPLGLRDLNGKVGGKLALPNLGEGELQTQYESQVSQIVFAINERNSSQVLDFRNAYLTYMSDPCSKGDFLERITHKVMDERNRLAILELRARALIDLIQKSPDNAETILPYCENILKDLDLPSPHATVKAIEQAKEGARGMIGAGQ